MNKHLTVRQAQTRAAWAKTLEEVGAAQGWEFLAENDMWIHDNGKAVSNAEFCAHVYVAGYSPAPF